MAKILVYAELNAGKLQPTALELMAKARELGDVEAVALGTGAKAAAATLGKHGAKVVHVSEDKAFDDYIAEPATDVLAALHKEHAPDLVLSARAARESGADVLSLVNTFVGMAIDWRRKRGLQLVDLFRDFALISTTRATASSRFALER